MEAYYPDNHITVYNKDCRSMTELDDSSVQCVVTSPPYWGLRKYSGEQELIWGNKDCEHQWGDELVADTRRADFKNWEHNAEAGISNIPPHIKVSQGNFCSLCGAWKGAYGLEPKPEMYVQHTIEILREIRRVLRKDGVVWWNIGDSYWGGKGQSGQQTPEYQLERFNSGKSHNRLQLGGPGLTMPKDGKHSSIKPKDLCLIPFRVAIAAQEDGWYIRSDIIWSKPNPMPESVTDRPTNSHESILMLTKSGTPQYWTHRDDGGTREKPKADYRWVNQITREEVALEPSDWKQKIKCPDCDATGKVKIHLGLDVWQEKQCPTCQGKKETQLWKRINLWKGHDYYWDADAVRESSITGNGASQGKATGKRFGGPDTNPVSGFGERELFNNPLGRNIRSVWEFPTQPYPEAHFAVFPEKLPEICIKAATPEVGCCSKCGAPWERITENKPMEIRRTDWGDKAGNRTASSGTMIKPNESKTLGWQPTCKCNADKVPSVVLDPFAGVGTTLWVAKKLNRRAVGYEVSREYCELITDRTRQQVML